ncbi:hypothetical protein P170DRAFT_177012 [Aspergillus steynii IBT 23096]|uniref:Uncharacterized protein n=1 Tax=Aspergillus steynii IBT 23096 TaxID=1392250 RepID=A0A2I2G8H4_9EURO|nr:uncharacterized protein P170DRAFT_177012 [Aspergillus steynii IBT 23096]PLB49168.1 hypothetical protein P170DRAFT_177012 [Aspergillus steynii IBT 23096]
MPGMPPRRISQYFKPPPFAHQASEQVSETPIKPPAPAPESSPPLSSHASPQAPDESASQLKRSLTRAAEASNASSEQLGPLDLEDEVVADPPSGAGSSFDHSQRVVKNGKEVVISSDGEDTDSVASFEAPDALFTKFAQPSVVVSAPASENDSDVFTPGGRRSKDGLTFGRFGKSKKASKVYKNTMDTLVTQAVDDNETEAGIAKLKAALEHDRARREAGAAGFDQANHLDENVLTSALGEQDDEIEMRRLLDAVRRTEAFDLEKTWTFFDYGSGLAPALDFPRHSISEKTYKNALSDPDSRERAFQSGMFDFALSKGCLSDDFLLWIFHSVPSEPREGLRHAYCRAFKHAKEERVKSIVTPDAVDVLFERLGATKEALAVSDPVVPHTLPKGNLPKVDVQHQAALLSILELLSGIAHLLSDTTREHVILLLFRLTLDISLTGDPTICSELEKTITIFFQSIPEDADDDLEFRLCTSLQITIKDNILQSRLLKHMLPSFEHIAKWRSRLALSFLLNDATPLSQDADIMLDLRRIIDVLKDPRFNIKHHKGKSKQNQNQHQHPHQSHHHTEYDYGWLSAITYLLSVVLDSGWSGIEFPSKEAKQEFNAEVDTLAERIKKIFTAIEDSGASHLKRTLAKGALEALHYRVVYSVRTKPPPKRTLFESLNTRNQPKMTHLWKGIKTEDTEMPIRPHEAQS